MFDIGGTELLLMAVVALVIIGPKDLPRVLRVIGQYTGKARTMTRHLRSGFDEMLRQAELEEMEKKWADYNRQVMAQTPAIADAAPTPAAQHPAAPDPTPAEAPAETASAETVVGEIAARETAAGETGAGGNPPSTSPPFPSAETPMVEAPSTEPPLSGTPPPETPTAGSGPDRP